MTLTDEQLELLRLIQRAGEIPLDRISCDGVYEVDALMALGLVTCGPRYPNGPRFVETTRSGDYRAFLGNMPDADEIHSAMMAANEGHYMQPVEQVAFIRGYQAALNARASKS